MSPSAGKPPTRSTRSTRPIAEILAIATITASCAAIGVGWGLPLAGEALKVALTIAIALLTSAPLLHWRGLMQLHLKPRRKILRSASIASVFTLSTGLAITVALAAWQHDSVVAAARSRFVQLADHLKLEVQRRFDRPLHALKGARGSHAASTSISRREFRDLVASYELEEDFAQVRGIGFIERVPRAGLRAFVERERADAAPEFEPRSSGLHDPLYVIKYIEPRLRNLPAWGFDVGQEPRRREAAERAIDTGEPTLTAPIRLVQDDRSTPGFLLYVPAYRTPLPPMDLATRRVELAGLYYSPIVARELLLGAAELFDGDLSFGFHDGNTAEASSEIFVSDGPDDRTAPGTGSAAAAARFHEQRSLALGGRILTLRIHSTPAFEAKIPYAGIWLTAAAGSALSLLMAALIWLLGAGRLRAEERARRMTADLDRLARVAQRTSNAVMICDAAHRVLWVNEGFTRMSGYRPEEAIGRNPRELIEHPQADVAATQAVADAITRGEARHLELLKRRKDGSGYWVDVDLQPVRNARGELAGYMEIDTEITVQRETQARLEAALRDTQALMRTIDTHAIVSFTDADGVITDVNDAFCQISGYTREELVGRTHAIVNSGVHDEGFWQDLWLALSAGASWRGRICNRSKGGQPYWVDSMIAPFVAADGRIERYVAIRTDVTASVQAREVLALERQRRDQIIEGTHVGTWEWNVESGEVVINERWAQMIGYTLDELAPISIATWTRFTHPDDLSRSSRELERHFNGEVDHYECEARMRHRDGRWIWVLDRGKLFSRAEDGRPLWMAGTHMDITERKAAEAALRASRALLDRVGRIAAIGGWALDFGSGECHWSEEIARLLDLDTEASPSIDALVQALGSEAGAAMRAALALARETGAGWDVEWPIETRDRGPTWVRSIGEVEDEDGRHTRVVGTMQDVTARHALQGELKRKNELLVSVLENLPCGVSVFDGELRLAAWNQRMQDLMGLPDDLMQSGRPHLAELLQFSAALGEFGEDGEASVARLLDEVRHPQRSKPFERLRPNGVPLEIRRAPMPGGGFVTTYTDISERKRAEAEVQRAAALLRAALETVDEAFVLYGPDDRLVLCNDKYRALYATSAEAIVPGATFEQIIRHGAERGQYAEAVGRVDAWVAERMAAHRRSNRSFLQTLDDGRVVRVVERRMPDGHTVGFRIDVSDLERARLAAEAASLAKSRFLANMSHEIRTPMNAVLGMLQLLRRSPLDARQHDHATKAEGAARALLGILNDILDFSKIEAGKLALDSRPFPRDTWLQDIAVVLAGSQGDKPVDVLFDIDPAVPEVLVGDDMRLRQILVNLAGNAIKFTARGEVIVQLRLLSRTPGPLRLQVSVSDTGIGITPEQQQRIFDAFSQAESSTTRRFGGTGLGLAITQRLVTLMGSTLSLQSEPGVGSRFTFVVELGTSPEAAPERAGGLADLRTLLVDDNAAARAVFCSAGRSLGWQVDAAAHAEEALFLVRQAMAGHRAHDAVFVDARLEGTPAAALADTLAAELPASTVFILLASHALDDDPTDPQARRALDATLTKPFVACTLADAVRRALPSNTPGHPPPAASTVPPQRLEGLRILVAEDNAINRQIAEELLGAEGARLTMVGDGQAAVDVLRAHPRQPFDAVLMDLQMPVMDGLTATATLRGDARLAGLPIIAMTANAMDADREACLAAGMNDHIGKPFDLKHLIATILQHARPQAAAPDRPPGPPAEAPGATPSSDLDVAAALERFGGRRAPFLRSLRAFLADLPTTSGRLSGLLASGRFDEAVRLMHGLKGLSGTLGADALGRCAGDIEDLLAQHAGAVQAPMQEPAGTAIVERWREAATRAHQGLAAVEAQWAEAQTHGLPVNDPPPTLDPIRKAAALQALAALLDAHDLQAEDALALLKANGDVDDSRHIAALEVAMERLDFESALARCQSWTESLRIDATVVVSDEAN